MQFGRLTEALLGRIRGIVGDENLVVGDQKTLERSAYDQVADKRYGHLPDVVVFPRTTDQIAELLVFANDHLIPITPRGAGSGLSGGAVPIYGGICMSLEKMNRILEIDDRNLTVTLEPGVVTRELDRKQTV